MNVENKNEGTEKEEGSWTSSYWALGPGTG